MTESALTLLCRTFLTSSTSLTQGQICAKEMAAPKNPAGHQLDTPKALVYKRLAILSCRGQSSFSVGIWPFQPPLGSH